jgi:hypothetical protein
MWHYVDAGRYAQQLRPFVEAFGPDQLLVLSYEELTADPEAELRRCFGFIGVDEDLVTDLGREVNASGTPRSRLLVRVAHRARNYPPLRRTVRRLIPYETRERIRQANLTAADMAESDKDRLNALFCDERARLADLLGDRAPSWASAR